MILTETVDLDYPPDAVIAFLEDMDRHYLAWHPDHIAFRWIATGDAPKARLFFDERIGRIRLRSVMDVRRSADGRFAALTPTSAFLRLFFPVMTFAVEDRGTGRSRLVHRIRLRLGPLRGIAEPILLGPLRRHMAEEAGNLHRLIAGR